MSTISMEAVMASTVTLERSLEEMNEILAETGEPPTTLEELERAGISLVGDES